MVNIGGFFVFVLILSKINVWVLWFSDLVLEIIFVLLLMVNRLFLLFDVMEYFIIERRFSFKDYL